MFFAPYKSPWTCKTPSCGIRAVIGVVVVAKSLFQVLCLAAIIATGGLALEDVDVEGFHDALPDSSYSEWLLAVADSMLGGMQKESPSEDGLDFWLPVTDCCGNLKVRAWIYNSNLLLR
jgi:hypothetical protein